jgi:uncharacterized protein YuzE
MRVTFDRRANAAYIYLVDIGSGEAVRQEVAGPVILDFDRSGHLVGIEVLRATKFLPQEVLDAAERSR